MFHTHQLSGQKQSHKNKLMPPAGQQVPCLKAISTVLGMYMTLYVPYEMFFKEQIRIYNFAN